jgi:hypothetical protein
MHPIGQPEQAVFRIKVSSANFSPEMPFMASSWVCWRFLHGSAFMPFSTSTFTGVPRL